LLTDGLLALMLWIVVWWYHRRAVNAVPVTVT
jgi:hypothetical protein